MARPREFQEAQVIDHATALFARLGFNGTSIDDLLAATNLKRGSLYKAFGSKRNLFELCLKSRLEESRDLGPVAQDLLIVALKELAASDLAIQNLCRAKILELGQAPLAVLLGNRLLGQIKEN